MQSQMLESKGDLIYSTLALSTLVDIMPCFPINTSGSVNPGRQVDRFKGRHYGKQILNKSLTYFCIPFKCIDTIYTCFLV